MITTEARTASAACRVTRDLGGELRRVSGETYAELSVDFSLKGVFLVLLTEKTPERELPMMPERLPDPDHEPRGSRRDRCMFP